MKNKILSLLVITGTLISVTGCATLIDKKNRLSVNMHKNEVKSILGRTFRAKASKVDTQGNVLDLWEVYDQETKNTYQIFFLNDRVSQWGKSEDLKSFPELYSPAYNP